jgi:hypothetical protein
MFKIITFCIGLSFCLKGSSQTHIYVHTDKTIYTAGENAWFKSYLLTQFIPDDAATTFIVRLYNQRSELVKEAIYPIQDGVASGGVRLPDELPEGGYLLTASIRSGKKITDAMTPFQKTIFVFNPRIKQPPINSTNSVSVTAVEYPVKISFTENNEKLIFKLQNQGAEQTEKKYMITGYIDGANIFQKQVSLPQGKYDGSFSTKELPPSKIKLVITDEGKIIGSADHFVKASEAVQPVSLLINKLSAHSIDSAEITLKFTDSITAHCSISITNADADLVDTAQSLVHKLLLDDVAFANAADTDYIHISGTVFYKRNDKPVKKDQLKILFSSSDSGVIVLQAPVVNGRFEFSKLVFDGKGKFQYGLTDDDEADVYVKLDSVIPEPAPKFTVSPDVFGAVFQYVQAKKELASVAYKDFEMFSKDSLNGLPSVVVRTRIKKPVDVVNQRYTKGLFGNMVTARVLDFINDVPSQNNLPILDYLQGQVAGLLITKQGYDYSLNSLRSSSMTGGMAKVKVYLNEQETMPTFLNSVRVMDVAFIKYWPPGTIQLPFLGTEGVLAVYTKTPMDLMASKIKMSFNYTGYEQEMFFESNSTSGSTIYWNPELIFVKENSRSIKFMNHADVKRLLVSVKGFTTEGQLIDYSRIVEVR